MKTPDSYINEIIKRLKKLYPDAHCSLTHSNPYELLVATILSAQCTDARVNLVTPALFKKYPTVESLAKAKQADVELLIKSTGFFRNKAKNLIAMAKDVSKNYGGKIPGEMESLHALAGVGRKTANVVLGNAFGKAAGVVVDTHVKRVSFRLGLTKHLNPEKVEQDLNRIVPSQNWVDYPHWIISHGREVCDARLPDCFRCLLKDICPKKGLNPKQLAAWSLKEETLALTLSASRSN